MNRVLACLGDPALGLAGLVLVIALALTSTGDPDTSGLVDFEGTSATAPAEPVVPIAPPASGPGEPQAPAPLDNPPSAVRTRLMTDHHVLVD